MIYWYVATYAYRQEETVVKLMDNTKHHLGLDNWDVRFWVPRLKYKESRDGRVKFHDIRMFPGYAFVGLSSNYGTREEFEHYLLTLESTTAAVRVLKVMCKDGIRRFYRLSPIDIQIVYAKQVAGVKPRKTNLSVGEPVEIVGGLFNGSRGVVRRIKDDEIFVSTDFMGTTALVKVDYKGVKRLSISADYHKLFKNLVWRAGSQNTVEAVCTGAIG
jgi:transcription antitermination factor NusG